MWTVRVFTLYPEIFPGPLASGLYKKALEKKIWSLEVINIRDYTTDKHKNVDDTPFGGGSGMVMRADVLANSLDKNISNKKERIIYLSPKGRKFDQIYSKKIATENVNIICGHFEGVDERILETRNIEEVSIGDFVLSGGEMAALVIIDSVVRLLPGVLGNFSSLAEESFENNLLEYPQYTKPQKWEEKEVPNVLLKGDHKKIKDWRLDQSEDITRRRRPDLWKKYKKNK
jgi:tRNA (guanine37-N1)-methyltransferase